MRTERLELSPLSGPDPKSGAATNYATSAGRPANIRIERHVKSGPKNRRKTGPTIGPDLEAFIGSLDLAPASALPSIDPEKARRMGQLLCNAGVLEQVAGGRLAEAFRAAGIDLVPEDPPEGSSPANAAEVDDDDE